MSVLVLKAVNGQLIELISTARQMTNIAEQKYLDQSQFMPLRSAQVPI